MAVTDITTNNHGQAVGLVNQETQEPNADQDILLEPNAEQDILLGKLLFQFLLSLLTCCSFPNDLDTAITDRLGR